MSDMSDFYDLVQEVAKLLRNTGHQVLLGGMSDAVFWTPVGSVTVFRPHIHFGTSLGIGFMTPNGRLSYPMTVANLSQRLRSEGLDVPLIVEAVGECDETEQPESVDAT